MNEESLFLEALLRAPQDRAAFLDKVCEGAPELRAAVEALLVAHEKPANLLDRAPAEFLQIPAPNNGDRVSRSAGPSAAFEVATSDFQRDALPGVVISGRYTLQEKIGEGGMGEVWVAKQTEPVKRKVAVKLIKTGMDSKAVIQRFEHERQALALMDHPNIAQVLDGGITPTGQPFFVMELVNGLPLNKFCDEARLSPRQRLELFVPICKAVQHAHQKGIVHRDLKPANILVTVVDGQPVPKVIDFGVAKAMMGKLIDESLSTGFGDVVGTLEYMAPEQAGFSNTDIDTRADIYSLGVILYELLTGLRPFDAKRLKQAAFTEIVRIIREEEPARPSTSVSSNVAAPSVAALRQTQPKQLAAMLRGELDWVVMKCLEKQRDRRFATANALGRDIQRYLADETVEARPPSTAYLAQKFLKRNRGPVFAAVLLFLSLVLGIVVSAWQAIRATKAESVAATQRDAANIAAEQEAKQRAEADRQKGIAELERDKALLAEQQAEAERKRADESKAEAQDVLKFFEKHVLAAVRPLNQEGGLGVGVSLRAAVDEAELQIGKQFDHRPTVEAAIRYVIGESYLYLGEPKLAIRQLERSRDLRKNALGPEHRDTLKSLNLLALAHQRDGRLEQALAEFESVFTVSTKSLGPEDPDTLEIMNDFGVALSNSDDLKRAFEILDQSLKSRRKAFGPHDLRTITSINNLAAAYWTQGNVNEVIKLMREAGDALETTLGPDHPDTLQIRSNLAMALLRSGNSTRITEAKTLLIETLKKQEAIITPDHPNTLATGDRLANAELLTGELDQSLERFKDTLARRKKRLGNRHADTLESLNNLARAYFLAKDLANVLIHMEEAQATSEFLLSAEHPTTMNTSNNLATVYLAVGRSADAEKLCLEIVPRAIKKLEIKHPQTQHYIHSLAECSLQTGNYARVEPYLRQLADFWRATNPKSTSYAGALAVLGQNLIGQQKFVEAAEALRECLSIQEKLGPKAWQTFHTKLLLGCALLGQKKDDQANPLVKDGWEGLKQQAATIPSEAKPRIVAAQKKVVQILESQEKGEEAARWRSEMESFFK